MGAIGHAVTRRSECDRSGRRHRASARGIAAALGLAACLVSIAPAGAETIIGNEFQHNSWTGSSRFDKLTGLFSHCAIAGAYRSGNYLSFAYAKSGLWLGIGNKKWSLKANAEYQITLEVDGGWKKPAVAVALANRQRTSWIVHVKLGDADQIVPILKNGNVLSVRTPKQTIKFSLTDVSAALTRLQECFDDNHSGKIKKSWPGRRPKANASLELPSLVPPPKPLGELRTVSLESGVSDAMLDPGFDNPGNVGPGSGSRGADVRDFGVWVKDVTAVGRELLGLVKLINHVDSLSMGYLSNSVTRDFAEKNGIVKLVELQADFEMVLRKLERVGDVPPAIDEKTERSGRTLIRHFRQLRDQIEVMIGDTKEAFALALKGDKAAYNRLFLKSFAQKISLLKTENLTLDTQILSEQRETAQTRLNRSFLYSNTALIHILTFLKEALSRKKLIDPSLPRQLTDKSLVSMESSITEGRRLARRLAYDYGWKGKFRESSSRRFMSRLARNYIDAFAAERLIADRLHSFAGTIFGIGENSSAANPKDIGRLISRQTVALDLLVKKRMELTTNRIALVSTVKISHAK